MFSELLAHPGVEERLVPGGPVGFMALHGGLEVGTLEVAAAAARRSGSSLYAVVVPSTEFSPRHSHRLTGFLEQVRVAFSIHGYGRDEWGDTVLVGGRNRRVAASLADALRRRGITAVDALERIPASLRGVHPANPVNLPVFGGVQVELPPGLREGPPVEQVVDALVATASVEIRTLCAGGSD